jgi:HK97 family phage prohead protease
MERSTFRYMLTKAVDQTGEFEGYLSTFGNVDYGNDIVAPGAFDKSLARWNAKRQLPAMYFGHDSMEPIGDWVDMRVDDKGLFVKGRLWIDGPAPVQKSIQAHRMLIGNGPKGMSIGYVTLDSERDAGGRRVLKELELMEGSVVSFGMNPDALITSAKSLISTDGKPVDIRTAEKVLRDAGLSANQAKAVLADGWKVLRDAELPKDKDLDDLLSTITALTKRIP